MCKTRRARDSAACQEKQNVLKRLAACTLHFCLHACTLLVGWLQAYHQQDAQGKHDLIKKYQDKGGIRNLGWVASYMESSETLNQEKATNKKGFMTRDTILGLNGFTVGMNLKENRADVVLQGILKKCYDQHKLDGSSEELKQLDSEVPELSTYYYIHAEVRDEATSSKRTIFQQATDLKQAGLQKMLDDGGMGQVEIKIENPEKLEAISQAKVVKAGKDKIEKEIGLLKDLLSHGEERQKKEPELEKILLEGQKHLQEVQAFVDAARKRLSVVAGMEKAGNHDGEAWDKVGEDLKQQAALATVHMDGLKSFRLRMSALIKV